MKKYWQRKFRSDVGKADFSPFCIRAKTFFKNHYVSIRRYTNKTTFTIVERYHKLKTLANHGCVQF